MQLFLFDVTVASTAYRDSQGPANTGFPIVVTTLHVNMMFLQLDRTQLLICQQNFLSKQLVASTILKIFELQLRLVSMHGRITKYTRGFSDILEMIFCPFLPTIGFHDTPL